jgi:hypothetical protein
MNLERLMLLIRIKEQKTGKKQIENEIARLIGRYYWINFQFGVSLEYTKKDLLADAEPIGELIDWRGGYKLIYKDGTEKVYN